MRISDWSSDVCSSDLGAALIRRRPDVRQAERRLAAATARIGVETAALYPTVSLGASAGTTSRTIEGLVSDSALHFSIGPLISWSFPNWDVARARIDQASATTKATLAERSEEHTSELQSLMRISYAVFCLKKKKNKKKILIEYKTI